jgi:ubiquinone/menaquinone biosynthesis C-methylase UbiE
MTIMPPADSTTDFNERAKTWDDDPMKTARAQAVAQGIRARVPLASAMAGLEYGCGTGLLSFALHLHFRHIVLADNSAGMLAVLQKKIDGAGILNMHPMMLDLMTDPPPPDRFDIVFSLMTFHHIPDTDRILNEFFALLASPGYLCIADLDSEDGSFHGADFSGHKGFDREELAQKAANAGFTNITFSSVFNISKGLPPKDFPVFLMVAEKS